ncbi:MFS transporter [Cellulomonas edaphi]|uniref:MFS transporter n=1 Tax=Cellulomonas edaphi TaxID=3053468 RepID=A0ABT7S366_9CELL|nr:MFS transporter [Cellulomons edaphi]MDM7830068.1 MFS transporter [Cellulomons edaphi]
MPESTPDVALRRARVAVAGLFFTNGAIFANLFPEYPAIKAELGLSNAQYGAAIAAFPVGALLAGLAAGVLVRRFRSSRVAVAGTIVTGAGILLAGVSTTWAMLATGLLVAGAMDAITDVAQNAHGLRVQRRYGRSILNSFHAVWSIGAVSGGLMGALAVSLGMSRAAHLAVSGLLFSLMALGCYRFLLPGPEDAEREEDGASTAARPPMSRLALVVTMTALVVIAASGSIVEDSGSTWAAVYLSTSLDAPLSVAAFGFVALIGAQFVGRLLGDRLVDRFGQRAMARTGGALTAVGMGLALAVPSVPGTIVGFAAAGFGIATLVPAAMHGADSLPGLRPGTGLAVLSWLMRLGFLLSPPIVGLIADATSLRAGLLVVPVAGVLVVIASQVLDTTRRTSVREPVEVA